MLEIDLFGTERRLPLASLVEPPVRLSLFDAAAEASALRSGRAKSQERAEIVAPSPNAPWRCLCGVALRRVRRGGLACPECDR